MDILYLLVPLSVVLVLLILGALWFAVDRGQFDNLEQEGERILRDD
ncbi:MAG: cbb3-type cytochrome oxidase assembly protein CcoS [Burkholderiaceae bacterium]